MGSVIRVVSRSLISIGLLLVLSLLATPALAAPPQIIVDSGKVTVDRDNTGALTATVTVLNVSDTGIPLPKAILEGHEDSVVDITGASELAAASRTALTLTFHDPLPADPKVILEFSSGVTFSSYTIPLTQPDPKLDWALIGWSLLAGLIGSLVLAAATALRALFFSSGKEWRWNWLRVAKPNRLRDRGIKFLQSLDYLGTDWSFKDNWFSSVTVGAGALVGLLGTTGVFESIFGGGAASKHGLAVLAVVGAIAAVSAAIGPVFLKVIGHDPTVPNMLGTLVAAFFSFTGAAAQVCALTIVGRRLAGAGSTTATWVLWAGIFVGAVASWAAWTLLWKNILAGATVPSPSLSAQEKAALIMAKATDPKLTDEEKERLLVLRHQAEKLLRAARILDSNYRDEDHEAVPGERDWAGKYGAHYLPAEPKRNSLL